MLQALKTTIQKTGVHMRRIWNLLPFIPLHVRLARGFIPPSIHEQLRRRQAVKWGLWSPEDAGATLWARRERSYDVLNDGLKHLAASSEVRLDVLHLLAQCAWVDVREAAVKNKKYPLSQLSHILSLDNVFQGFYSGFSKTLAENLVRERLATETTPALASCLCAPDLGNLQFFVEEELLRRSSKCENAAGPFDA